MQLAQVVLFICFRVYSMYDKEQLITLAKQGKILTHKCTKCNSLHLSTVYFCQKCGNKEFECVILDGIGAVVTFTIITVPPAGFEKYTPYAFVIFHIDNSDLRISGFMAGITTPKDLPIGTRVKITDFDERGIIVEKQ